MRHTTFAAALLTLSTLALRPIAAQTTSSDTTTTPSTERAAGDLLHVMHLDDQWPHMIDAELDAMVVNQPLMAPYRETMRVFFVKYAGWPAVEPAMQHLYAQTFTEAELHDLSTFYRTPTGQKALAKMAELQARGRALGQQVVQAHKDELTAAIAARAQELAHDTSGASHASH
jgi:uncharacterized protein